MRWFNRRKQSTNSNSVAENKETVSRLLDFFFDGSVVTKQFERIESWPFIEAKDIYDCYSWLISSAFSLGASKKHIKEIIQFITQKLFDVFAEKISLAEKDLYDLYCTDDIFWPASLHFANQFTCALYHICVTYDLDFNEIFKSVEDLKVCVNDNDVGLFDWSFSNFVNILKRDEFFSSTDGIATIEEACHAIQKLISNHFDTFMENASHEDIDDLITFDIRYKRFLDWDVFGLVCGTLDNVEVKKGNVDTIKAIARHYPGIMSQAFTSHVYATLYAAPTDPYDVVAKAIVYSDIIDTFDEISKLNEYGIESFCDLASDWKYILGQCLLKTNGIVVNTVCDVFRENFGISQKAIDDVIQDYVSSSFSIEVAFIFNKVGEIERLAANRTVYDYVCQVYPAFIELLLDKNLQDD